MKELIERIKTEHDFQDHFRDETNCRKFLEYMRWEGGDPWCPYCSYSEVYKFRDGKRFKCKHCKRDFLVTTGTIFERSRISLRIWFSTIYEYVQRTNGCSANSLSERLGMSYKTAWFMHHRIMELFRVNLDDYEPEIGIHEFDTIGVGAEEKFMCKSRKARRTTVRGHAHRYSVFTKVLRGKHIMGRAMKPYPTKSEIFDFLKKTVHPDSEVYCDNGKEHSGLEVYFPKCRKFVHKIKNFGGGKEHSNTVEGAFSKFRSNLKTYVRVGPQYLQRYFDEFCFTYNHRTIGRKTPMERFAEAFKNVNRKITLRKLQEQGKKSVLDLSGE